MVVLCLPAWSSSASNPPMSKSESVKVVFRSVPSSLSSGNDFNTKLRGVKFSFLSCSLT